LRAGKFAAAIRVVSGKLAAAAPDDADGIEELELGSAGC
jgi:hypothetical protein